MAERVETLVYKYQCCLDCPHCGYNYWLNTDYIEGCDLMEKRLDPELYLRMDGKDKFPRWCPLPTKERTV